MKNELALGYLSRLRGVNGYPSASALFSQLKKIHLQKYPNSKVKRIDLLAFVLRISVEDFCRDHTLLPVSLSNAANTNIAIIRDINIINKTSRQHLNEDGHRLSICCKCIDEDKKYLGFAYYRRDHQLPGFGTCMKHDCELQEGYVSLMDSPDEMKNFIELETAVGTVLESPCLNTYQTIVDEWSHSLLLLNKPTMVKFLQMHGKRKGLSWAKTNPQNLFSDLVSRSFPAYFLNKVINGYGNKRIGEFHSGLDFILVSNKRTHLETYLYALALSVLFDSAEEALNSWAKFQRANPTLQFPIWLTKSTKMFYEPEEFKVIYVASGGDRKIIAASINCSISFVNALLQKNKLPSLCSTRSEVLEIFIDVQNGVGFFVALRKHSISLISFQNFLRRCRDTSIETKRLIASAAINRIHSLKEKPSNKTNDLIVNFSIV